MKLPIITRNAHEAKINELQSELNRLKSPMFPDHQNQEIEYLFTCKKGHRYGHYPSPWDMPGVRGLRLRRALELAAYNLDNNIVGDFFKQFFDDFNAGEIGKVAHGMHKMQKRMELPSGPDVVLQLAALFYIREDENPEAVDDMILNEKITDWENDEKALSFFLSQSYRQILGFGDISEESLMQSLGQIQSELKSLMPD